LLWDITIVVVIGHAVIGMNSDGSNKEKIYKYKVLGTPFQQSDQIIKTLQMY